MASRGRQQDIQKTLDEATAALCFLEALPKEGSPEIMVPLGKAAFFPGRLVDTQRCELRMGELESLLHSGSPEIRQRR